MKLEVSISGVIEEIGGNGSVDIAIALKILDM